MSSEDVLDRILDGEPMLILFTPELRRQLRKRLIQRMAESRREMERLEHDYEPKDCEKDDLPNLNNYLRCDQERNLTL
jgi:hypothetical protein